MPIFHGAHVKAVMLMVFMARGLTHEQVIEKFVPRLKGMAAKIEQLAFVDQAPDP